MPYPTKLTLESIRDAALHLADEAGLPAVGIRAVAERLDVRPSALYRHCGDAMGLVALVAEWSAAELCDTVQKALHDAGTAPDARFMLMARTYRDYALAHPARYAALMTDTTTSVWNAQPGAERKALWNLLLHVVGALTGHADDTDAAVAVWSYLHGFAALHASGLFGASGPRNGFERGLQTLTVGLQSQMAPASSYLDSELG